MKLLETVLAFIFGLFIGSFYNVVAMRTLKGEDIVFARSHCPVCKHELEPMDLIPVFSYLFLRGKCRYCKTKISPLYLCGELAAGLTFALYYWLFGLSFDFVIHAVTGSMLVILVITDLIDKTVPNKIVFPTLGIVLILRIIRGENLVFYLISAFAIFALLFAVMTLSGGKLGGGDVKLYAVVGLTIGIWNSLISIFLASLFGLMLAIPLILLKRMDWKQPLPFVPFIWLGVLVSYFVQITL